MNIVEYTEKLKYYNSEHPYVPPRFYKEHWAAFALLHIYPSPSLYLSISDGIISTFYAASGSPGSQTMTTITTLHNLVRWPLWQVLC